MSELDACQCTPALFRAILPRVFFKKIGKFSFICMGFRSQRVWIMGYHRCMGYGLGFSAYQVGNKKYLWGKREYGISELWVKRASTVAHNLWGQCKSPSKSPVIHSPAYRNTQYI